MHGLQGDGVFMNRTKIIFLFVVLMLQVITACSPQNTQGERWVIFSEEQARELGIADWFAQSGQSTEYWTPVEKDVLVIENGLSTFLQNNSDNFYSQGTPIWQRLDEYNRQYVGITLGGKNIVYANFFCDSFETEWRKEFVFVLDGGDCFFQFKYDVNTDDFFDLQVNGEA